MYYRTCTGCQLAKTDCRHRAYLRDKLAGMGITSIKFACAFRKPLFEPGEPVSVWLTARDDADGEDYGEQLEATVIKYIGSKVLAFVHPDQDGRDLLMNESGYVKVSAQHVSKRDGEQRIVCPICSALDGNHVDGWTCHYAAEQAKKAADREAQRTAEVIF